MNISNYRGSHCYIVESGIKHHNHTVINWMIVRWKTRPCRNHSIPHNHIF